MGAARDFMNHNFGKYKNSRNQPVHLSKNMKMAKDLVSKNINYNSPTQYIVESIVVFVSEDGKPVPNTTFLKYPGEIKVYNKRSAKKFIKKFFRGTKQDKNTEYAEKYLKRLVQ